MKIGILSLNRNLYSTCSLYRAAEKRGHKVQVINYLKCHMVIASHRPEMFLGDEALEDFDAIIPRIGSTHTFFGCAVVRQFEMMKVYSVNESVAITRARDKLRSLQLLSRKGVGLPITAFAHGSNGASELVKQVGGAPMVIKLVEGTQGVGVVLAETPSAAESVIEAFGGLNANILAQEYIEESKGMDVRCLVVGNKVVASMKRQAREGEFRSNRHLGGTSSPVKISPEERSAAVRAARILGLGVAGVDLLRSHHGPVVIEVNTTPGLEGIEMTTGKDVSGAIIEHIEKHAREGNTRTKGKG